MSTLAKIFAFVTLVFAIALVAGLVVYMKNNQSYRTQLMEAQAANKTAQDRLNNQVKDLGEERDQAVQKAAESARIAADTQQRLGAAEALLAEKDKELKSKEVLIATFSSDVAAIRNKQQDQDAQLKALSDERNEQRMLKDEALRGQERAEDELKSCREALQNAEKALEHMKSLQDQTQATVFSMREAAPALVFQSAKPDAPLINGEVVNVDNEKGLVMISVGKDDGVMTGYAFEVFRPDEYVGRIWIFEVQDERAFGKIDPQMTMDPTTSQPKMIRDKDYVTTRLQ